MALQHPIARIIGHERHVTRLGYTYEHGVSRTPCRFGLAASFSTCNYELVPMQVDRMVVHPQIDEADADALSVPHDERSVGWTRFSVERNPVELHVHAVWDIVLRQGCVVCHDSREVVY